MNQVRFRLFALGLAALLAAPAARGGDSPGPDKAFLKIDGCKKDKFDCAWVSPEFSFAGKTIHVKRFEKTCEAPKGSADGDLQWKNAGEFLQRVFASEVNDGLRKGTKFVSGGSGDYVLQGQITEFRHPKEGASWGGWIGEAAGSGTIVYDWKIVDGSGRTLVAVHHKTLCAASQTLDDRVNSFYGDEVISFVNAHSK